MNPFPIRIENPIKYAGPPPEVADVVIIGGGVIGVMSAWFAARKGLRVVVVEKGLIAGEQSSRNWGWIRQQGRDPAELPIMIDSNRIWRGFDAPLRDEIGLRKTGTLYLANDSAQMARHEAWMVHARAHDLDSRLLSGAEVAAMLPESAHKWAGGLWTASDLRAEPWAAVPALARAAARDGVHFVEHCAARGLERAMGAISGVITEQGTIACEMVVLAGGAWSSLFLRRHGVNIPQLSVRSTVAATTPLPDVYGGGAVDDRFAFRRRIDGGYSLAPEGLQEIYLGPDAFRALRHYLSQLKSNPFGTVFHPMAPRGFPDAWSTPRRWRMDQPSPFEAMRILNPPPNRKKVGKIARQFAQTFPSLGPVDIATSWAGMIDALPDVVPVVDHARDIPGLIVATGMCGHGFGIGPGFGRVIANMVNGDDPGFDLHRFRLSRFADGSNLDLGPTI